MSHLLVQLRVEDRPCVVVGGGRVATLRVLRLLRHGARVSVVAPEVTEEIGELAASGSIELHRRVATEADLRGAHLAVLCTDDPAVQERLAASAGADLVTRADDASASDVLWVAERSFGPLRVAVGTGGRAPAVSAWAADELVEGIDGLLGADAVTLERLVDLVAEVRAEVRAGAPEASKPRLNWRSAIDRSMLELIRSGRMAEAKERLKACRSSS